MGRLRRHEKGQTMVEFALIMPVLALMLLAIIDFGRVTSAGLIVSHGAREGARVAATGAPAATVVAWVQSTTSGLDPANLTVGTANTQGPSGQPVTVGVTYTVSIVTPLISSFFPQNPYPVSSVAVMRLE